MSAQTPVNPVIKILLAHCPIDVFFLAHAYLERFGAAEGRRTAGAR